MSRPKPNEPQIDYDLSPFMPHNMSHSISFENDSVETLREKLQIKSEALNLLAKQLELCNKEKVEYKRLIDTLYDKNLALKKSLYFKENEVDADENFFPSTDSTQSSKHKKSGNVKKISPNSSNNCLLNDIDSEDYLKILKDLIKSLQREKHDLIQKYEESEQQLHDSRSDLRLLREQIVRQRVGSLNEGLANFADSTNLHQQTATNNQQQQTLNQREDLIKEIEKLREEKQTIENDLKLGLCQKEELEIERDSFKVKYNKLNEFLLQTFCSNNVATKDESSLDKNNNKRLLIDKSQISLNIDELLSQNKYLKESNENLLEEIELLKNSMKKAKQATNSELLVKVVNKKQIEALLGRAEQLLSEHQTGPTSLVDLINELRKLVESLIENLNDRITANVHQKKVNKMLATRIQDLEREIQVYLNRNKDGGEMGMMQLAGPNSSSSPLSTSIQLASLILPLMPEPILAQFGNNKSSEPTSNANFNHNKNSSFLINFDDENSNKN